MLKFNDMKEKTFENMSKKERMGFIFKLHNGSIIEKELNEIFDDKYSFNPNFKEELEFINQSEEVLKIDKSGNILENPSDLENCLIVYLVKDRLKRTENMIEKIF